MEAIPRHPEPASDSSLDALDAMGPDRGCVVGIGLDVEPIAWAQEQVSVLSRMKDDAPGYAVEDLLVAVAVPPVTVAGAVAPAPRIGTAL